MRRSLQTTERGRGRERGGEEKLAVEEPAGNRWEGLSNECGCECTSDLSVRRIWASSPSLSDSHSMSALSHLSVRRIWASPPTHAHTFKLTLSPVCAEELGLDRRQQHPGPAPGLLGVRLADADLRTWR